MAYEYFGVTDIANVSAELISSLVQEQLVEYLRLAPTVSDYSAMAMPGYKQIAIPRGSDLSAAAKGEGTEFEAQHFTYATDDLALDKHYVVPVDVEDIAQIQSRVPLMQDLVARMAVALADQIDSDIYDALKTCSTAAPDHVIQYNDAVNEDLELVDITECRKLLNIQKVPQMDRYLLICPSQEKNMLGISNFIKANEYGAREALLNGEIGRVFGFTVIMSNVCESDNYTLAYHKSHVAYAQQMGVKIEFFFYNIVH